MPINAEYAAKPSMEMEQGGCIGRCIEDVRYLWMMDLRKLIRNEVLNALSAPHVNEVEDDEDDEEMDYSHLKDEAFLKSLAPQFAAAAQKVYDEWEQDEEGVDEMLGTGGICQDIAAGICDVMSRNGIDCSTVSQSIGEQHVYSVCQIQEGVYEVDIPPYSYETGGGYTWTKISDVKFDETYITIHRLSSDPSEFEQYTADF